MTLVFLAGFGLAAGPSRHVPVDSDTYDYAYGALALLHGSYEAEWPGVSLHIPRYSPGFALMLTPAVALGGVQSAGWVPYLCGLLLGLLVAWLAALVSKPIAAPLAVATVLFAAAPSTFASVVMSDIPATTLGVLQLVVLARGRTAWSALAAGLLAGALIWVRPATVVLGLAALGGLTALTGWRRLAACYAIGLCLPLAALGAWQWLTYGSPLTSGYEAAWAVAPFSPQYVVGPPWKSDSWDLGGEAATWNLPNGLVYPLQLLGTDAFLSLPGVGMVGLVGLVRLAQRRGPAGVVGRFGLLSVPLTLAVCVPYYWQSARFLLLPGALLGLAAATLLAEAIGGLAQRLTRELKGPPFAGTLTDRPRYPADHRARRVHPT